MSYHQTILLGNVGNDPVSAAAKSGTTITKFSIAVTDGYGDNQKTVWYKCTAFGKSAEALAQHVRKGSKLLVVGRISTSESEQNGVKRYYWELIVDRWTFAGSKTQGQTEQPESASAPDDELDSDIPFAWLLPFLGSPALIEVMKSVPLAS